MKREEIESLISEGKSLNQISKEIGNYQKYQNETKKCVREIFGFETLTLDPLFVSQNIPQVELLMEIRCPNFFIDTFCLHEPLHRLLKLLKKAFYYPIIIFNDILTSCGRCQTRLPNYLRCNEPKFFSPSYSSLTHEP